MLDLYVSLALIVEEAHELGSRMQAVPLEILHPGSLHKIAQLTSPESHEARLRNLDDTY